MIAQPYTRIISKSYKINVTGETSLYESDCSLGLLLID